MSKGAVGEGRGGEPRRAAGDAKGVERDKWAPNDRPTIEEEEGRR